MTIAVLRFFVMTFPQTRCVVGGFVVLAALAAWLLTVGSGGDVETALASVLFLQMFAASTGFREPANRGYYDAVLVGGASRHAIGLGHWAASILPGVVCWLAIGLMEPAFRPVPDLVGWQPRAWVALLLVSTISWSISLPLPRFSGGVTWMATIFGLVATGTGMFKFRAILLANDPPTGTDVLSSSALLTACPFLLLARSAVTEAPLVLLSGLLTSMFALGIGLLYVSRREYRLTQAP